MKRFCVFALILSAALLVMSHPGEATKRMPGGSVTVNLTAVDTPYTEILRIATKPEYYENQADVVLLHIEGVSLSGGTEALIRVLPAWEYGDSAISDDVIYLTYSDLLDSAAVSLHGTRECIVVPRWGHAAALSNTFHVLPPYLVVQLQENHTSGTVKVEALLLYGDTK